MSTTPGTDAVDQPGTDAVERLSVVGSPGERGNSRRTTIIVDRKPLAVLTRAVVTGLARAGRSENGDVETNLRSVLASAATPSAALASRPVAPSISSAAVAAPPAIARTTVVRPLTSLRVVADALGFGTSAGSPTSGGPLGLFGSFVQVVFAGGRGRFGLINHAPTAAPVTTELLASRDITGTLGAADADRDVLHYGVAQGPEHGDVVIRSDGTFTYTPDPGYVGTDHFLATVNDNHRALFEIDAAGTTFSHFRSHPTVVPVTLEVPPADSNGVESTRTFEIINFSNKDLVFRGYPEGFGNTRNGPPTGQVLKPGQSVTIEVVYSAVESRTVVATWGTSLTSTDTYDADLYVEGFTAAASVSCAQNGAGAKGSCGQPTKISGTVVTFLDANPRTIEITSQQAQQQRDVFNQLCNDSSKATCSFKSVRTVETYGDRSPFGGPVSNPDPDRSHPPVTFTVSDSQTEGSSDTFGLSTKLSFGNVAKTIGFEITATYQRQWTRSRTFTQSITVPVPPQVSRQVYIEPPVHRDYGDFTIVSGNTTYVLKNVYFDSVDPSRPGRYTVDYQPLPPQV